MFVMYAKTSLLISFLATAPEMLKAPAPFGAREAASAAEPAVALIVELSIASMSNSAT